MAKVQSFLSNIDFRRKYKMKNIIYEHHHDRDPNFTIGINIDGDVPKHFHNCIEILYVISGKMKATVGDRTLEAEPDDIIFVHNYYVHSYEPDPKYTKYFMVIPTNYSGDVGKILKKSTLPVKLDDKDFNRTLLEFIDILYYGNEQMPSLTKKGYINIIMGHLFNHYPSLPIENQGSIDFILDVLKYINENYSSPLTLESISSNFGYNKYYFSRLFNHYVGENISNYINIVRVQRFTELAKDQKNPAVATLARECGFDSLNTFYRSFKKIYGMTPKNFFAKRA